MYRFHSGHEFAFFFHIYTYILIKLRKYELKKSILQKSDSRPNKTPLKKSPPLFTANFLVNSLSAGVVFQLISAHCYRVNFSAEQKSGTRIRRKMKTVRIGPALSRDIFNLDRAENNCFPAEQKTEPPRVYYTA